MWWSTIATLSSTIPVGVGGNADEAGLVESDQDGDGVSGVDGVRCTPIADFGGGGSGEAMGWAWG